MGVMHFLIPYYNPKHQDSKPNTFWTLKHQNAQQLKTKGRAWYWWSDHSPLS